MQRQIDWKLSRRSKNVRRSKEERQMTLNVGWYTTAGGSGSKAMFESVIDSINAGVLDAKISFVFVNRELGESTATDKFMDIVEENNIPLVAKSSVNFRKAAGEPISRNKDQLPPWRYRFDREILDLTEQYPADIGVMAGYMLIFTGSFVEKRLLLNLHPALPSGPIGTWQDVIHELMRSNVRTSGVMAHLAVPEVDRGPPVTFCSYPLDTQQMMSNLWENYANNDSGTVNSTHKELLFDAIRKEGLRRESIFLVATLRRLAQGSINDLDGSLISNHSLPLDLTQDVEELLEAS